MTRWLDPKLQPYREVNRRPSPRQESVSRPAIAPVVICESPRTRAELFEVLENAPLSIFSANERNLISTLFHLDRLIVSEFMLPAMKIIYINSTETLGPLTLDRLYKSGLTHFPVLKRGQVVGYISTARLNNLEIREKTQAKDLLEPNIFYIRNDYSLRQALDAFLRNECYLCLVVDHYGQVVGLLDFSDLCQTLFGATTQDHFLRDDDPLAVAKRRFPVEVNLEEAVHG